MDVFLGRIRDITQSGPPFAVFCINYGEKVRSGTYMYIIKIVYKLNRKFNGKILYQIYSIYFVFVCCVYSLYVVMLGLEIKNFSLKRAGHPHI